MGIEMSKYPGIGATEIEAAHSHAQKIANLHHFVNFPHGDHTHMYIRKQGLYRMNFTRLEDGRILSIGIWLGDDPLPGVCTQKFLRFLDNKPIYRPESVLDAL